MLEVQHIDTIDKIVRIIGYPTLIGLISWGIRTYDAGKRELQEIHAGQKEAVTSVAAVKVQMDKLETNHMFHMQGSLGRLETQGTAQISLLTNIDKGIAVIAAKQ